MSRSAGPAAFALAAFALALGAAPLYAQEGEGAERAPVTLVVVGDAEEAVLGAARESELPITLRVASAPARDVAPPAPRPRPALSAARDAYVNADFEACLAALGSLDAVTDALGEGGPGARDAAARLAFWRVACHGAAGDRPAAERAAERMATLRLPIPADAALATPDLERLLADAYERVSARPPAALRVEASIPGRMQVDALESCAVPCERALPPGEHVLRFEADGAVPEARLAQAPGALRFEPAPAPPELAARQWAARAARGDLESTASVALLARAVRARNLVFLLGEREREAVHLRGALAVDGEVASRAARRGAAEETTEALLRELLVRGEVLAPEPPLWRRPGFWVGILAAAAVAAGVTVGVLHEPPTRTEVTF